MPLLQIDIKLLLDSRTKLRVLIALDYATMYAGTSYSIFDRIITLYTILKFIFGRPNGGG